MRITRLAALVILAGLMGCGAQTDDPPSPTVEDVSMEIADLKKLEDELYRHGLAGFRRIREAHPHDTFYCFAFYTSGEFSYIALTASTHEGLTQVANKYKKKPGYQARSIEDLKLDLKWSPDDSPLHASEENFLAQLDPLMQAVAKEMRRRDGKSFDEFVSQVRSAIANALQRIEAEGVFGQGAERNKVVINLLMGDQSDEDRIGFAELVNPPESVAMLKQDLEAASRLRP